VMLFGLGCCEGRGYTRGCNGFREFVEIGWALRVSIHVSADGYGYKWRFFVYNFSLMWVLLGTSVLLLVSAWNGQDIDVRYLLNVLTFFAYIKIFVSSNEPH